MTNDLYIKAIPSDENLFVKKMHALDRAWQFNYIIKAAKFDHIFMLPAHE